MTETSTKFTEAHFNAKADRYYLALRSYPLARMTELLPFFFLINTFIKRDTRALTASDMLCGCGYVSSALNGCFRQIHGVDVSERMLRYYPFSPRIEKLKAAVDQHSELLRKKINVDVIVSLAGLHHVYELTDGELNKQRSNKLQQSVLAGWAEALPVNGVMIIADVSMPEHKPKFQSHKFSLINGDTPLAKRYQKYRGDMISQFNGLDDLIPGTPNTIDDYINTIIKNVPSVVEAQPGLWFREVVSRYGIYGHVDNFLNPQMVIKSVVDKSSFDVAYIEIPTPWIFPDYDAFLYFFYEKFVFGGVVHSLTQIDVKIRNLILNRASELLGITKLKGGTIAVGWRLGFYVFRRKETS